MPVVPGPGNAYYMGPMQQAYSQTLFGEEIAFDDNDAEWCAIRVPRSGIITGITAQFFCKDGFTIAPGIDATLYVLVYSALDPAIVFTPLTDTLTPFTPALDVDLPAHSILRAGNASLNVPISFGEDLLVTLGIIARAAPDYEYPLMGEAIVTISID